MPLPEATAQPGQTGYRFLPTWYAHAQWGILAVALALRAWLAWRGGQFFWPDETRFVLSQKAAQALADGRLRDAAELLFAQPDHLLFKLIGLVPAGLQLACGAPAWLPAMFFAAASTWVLWLVARVARMAGASDQESLVALTLAACTTSLFYYSRHYFPYDLSLGCMLLALMASLRRPLTAAPAFLTGVWASLGFLLYNGYWTVTATVLLFHVLALRPLGRSAAKFAVFTALGAMLPVVAVVLVGRLLGYDLVRGAIEFAGTVTQGDLGQAWKFVPAYLWVSEHGLALLWGVALVAALPIALYTRRFSAAYWALFSLVLAVFIVAPSDLLHRFALSARHVRALTPFLCLAAAQALCRLLPAGAQRLMLPWMLLAALAQAAFNFTRPVNQVFPDGFLRLAEEHIGASLAQDLGPYAVVNCTFFHDPAWVKTGPDAGQVQLQRDHPYQFLPYLFEGYPEEVRRRYLAQDLRMRIVRLDAGGPPPARHEDGAIELTLRFPGKPVSLLPEPLLLTGRKPKVDLVYIVYEGLDAFRIGLDHNGGGAILSERRPLDRSRPHRLLISMGSLHSKSREPNLTIMWDDELLLSTPLETYPATADEIDLGHNFAGLTTAIPLPMFEIVAVKWNVPAKSPTSFAAYPGAVHLHLYQPAELPTPQTIPLLSTGRPGTGDLIFLRHEGGSTYRIGHDHQGSGTVWSGAFQLDSAAHLDFAIAADILAEPPLATAGAIRPSRLHVRCNGQTVLNRTVFFHPTRPEEIQLAVNRVGSSVAPASSPVQIQAASAISPDALLPRVSASPGIIRLQLRLNHALSPGTAEPLVSTGRTGAGEVLFLRAENDGTYRIGWDHWGVAARFSEPFALNPSATHTFTIAMEPLFPPEGLVAPSAASLPSTLRHRLLVLKENQPLLDLPARFYPAIPGSSFVGVNSIGASSAGHLLSADIMQYTELSTAELLSLLPNP